MDQLPKVVMVVPLWKGSTWYPKAFELAREAYELTNCIVEGSPFTYALLLFDMQMSIPPTGWPSLKLSADREISHDR